jgi:hypothetical protein
MSQCGQKGEAARAMHVVTTRCGDRVCHYHLLRRSYREGRRVRKQTLANLSHLPEEAIAAIRQALAGKTLLSTDEAFEVRRSLPVGHVEAALVMAARLGVARLLDRAPSTERELALGMLVHGCSSRARSSQPRWRLGARRWPQNTWPAELARPRQPPIPRRVIRDNRPRRALRSRACNFASLALNESS